MITFRYSDDTYRIIIEIYPVGERISPVKLKIFNRRSEYNVLEASSFHLDHAELIASAYVGFEVNTIQDAKTGLESA